MSGRALFKDKQLRLCVVTTLATGTVVVTATEALLLPPKPLALSSTWDCKSGIDNEWLCRRSSSQGYNESLGSVTRGSQKQYPVEARSYPSSYHSPVVSEAGSAYNLPAPIMSPVNYQPEQSLVADSAVLLELLNAPPESYVLQWLAANNREQLENLKARYPVLQDATIAEYQRAGKQWYILLDGPYPSRIAAMAALKREPRSSIAGKFYPWTRSIASIQQLDLVRPEQLADSQRSPSGFPSQESAIAAEASYESPMPYSQSYGEENAVLHYSNPRLASHTAPPEVKQPTTPPTQRYGSIQQPNSDIYPPSGYKSNQNPGNQPRTNTPNYYPHTGQQDNNLAARQNRSFSTEQGQPGRKPVYEHPELSPNNHWQTIPPEAYQQSRKFSKAPVRSNSTQNPYQQQFSNLAHNQGQQQENNARRPQSHYGQSYPGAPLSSSVQPVYPENYSGYYESQNRIERQTQSPDYNIQQSEYSDYGYNPEFYREQKDQASSYSQQEADLHSFRETDSSTHYDAQANAVSYLNAPSGSFTIQWLAASTKSSLERLQLRYPALQNTRIIRYRKRNSDWYVLVGGTFNSHEAAQKALALPPLSRLTARLYPWVRSVDGLQKTIASSIRNAAPGQMDSHHAKPLERIISGPGNSYTIQWYAANRPEAVERMKQRFPELASAVTVHFRRNKRDWYVLLQGQYSNSQEAISAIKSPAMRDAARLLHPWTRPVNTLRRLNIQEQS